MRLPHCIRGCGPLPHVGPHPGNVVMLVLMVLGAVAGRRGGAWGMLGGAAFMLVCMLPLYLIGAHDRSKISEKEGQAAAARRLRQMVEADDVNH